MKKIDFFFDFLSPYSYFAWESHKELRKKFEFNYRPVMMGKLFQEHDIKGPGEIPAKRYLMLRSCFRYAARKNIEFKTPSEHPFNPLYVLRLACSSCSGDTQYEVIDSLWNFIWGKSLNPDSPEELAKFLNDHKLEGDLLIDKTSEREVKLELKSNTKDALSRKLFGVPSFCVEDETFWGNDSIPDMLEYIKNGICFDEELFNQRTNDIIL